MSKWVVLSDSLILRSLITATETKCSSESDGRYSVGKGATPPVILSQPLPSYTEEARLAHIEGEVLLQFIVR